MTSETRLIFMINMNDSLLEAAEDLLNQRGYSVKRIWTSATLWSELRNRLPSLVIYQFSNFSEDEFEILWLIQRIVPDVPVVVTSPVISVHNRAKIVKAEVAGYLRQPFTPEELRGMVEKYSGGAS